MFGAQRPPQQQQSLVSNALLERMKMGFMTGCLVGGTTGFLYGTFSVFKYLLHFSAPIGRAFD